MSKKKVIEDLDNLIALFKSNFSESSCASSYDSINEFDKISRPKLKVANKKEQTIAKGGSLSSDDFSSETNSNLVDLDVLLEELRSSKFFGRFDPVGQASNHNSSCSEELSACDKPVSSLATEGLDSLMESLAQLGANSPSKNKTLMPDPVHPPVSLSSAARVFSCSTSSLALPHRVTLDGPMGGLEEAVEPKDADSGSKGSCESCGKVIVGDVVSISGKTWHPRHFVCSKCRSPIGLSNFFERSGKFYCEDDFRLLVSPKCEACGRPILDVCVTVMDRAWHPEHFVCHSCGKLFVDGDGFHEHEGQIYCKKDYYELVAPRCGRCRRAIVAENFLSAMDKFWHISCFVCFDCGEPMGADSVYEVDGSPYCCRHYHARRGSLCHTCRAPIVGPCVSAMTKKFHPEHFACCFCQGRLTRDGFREHAEKAYCRHCYKRLFA